MRFVPRLCMISASATSDASLTSSAPPSPQWRFFVSWKLSAASWPIEPSGLPRQAAPTACAASSMRINPERRARSASGQRPVRQRAANVARSAPVDSGRLNGMRSGVVCSKP
jgi:hypothetical protein